MRCCDGNQKLHDAKFCDHAVASDTSGIRPCAISLIAETDRPRSPQPHRLLRADVPNVSGGHRHHDAERCVCRAIASRKKIKRDPIASRQLVNDHHHLLFSAKERVLFIGTRIDSVPLHRSGCANTTDRLGSYHRFTKCSVVSQSCQF